MVLTHPSLQSNTIGDVGAVAVAELLAVSSCGLRVLKYNLLVTEEQFSSRALTHTLWFFFFLSVLIYIYLPVCLFLFCYVCIRLIWPSFGAPSHMPPLWPRVFVVRVMLLCTILCSAWRPTPSEVLEVKRWAAVWRPIRHCVSSCKSLISTTRDYLLCELMRSQQYQTLSQFIYSLYRPPSLPCRSLLL